MTEVQNATLGVKFSQSAFVFLSLLDQWGIKYEESDLKEGPCGKMLRIKHEDGTEAKGMEKMRAVRFE